MSGRGGRDRVRRDYPPRSEEKRHHGRSSAPPSRHLWVGNISHNVSERMLADHFLQFGELESVAFQPGRSYAFLNFKYDEEAIAAIGALQGVSVAGNPLRIEFAKAEKALIPPRNEDHSHHRDERCSSVRRSPFPEMDSRVRHSSPEQSYHDNSKIDDKNAEPSEVLWVGFPASLKVDEVILRNAFSRYGEIEKISVFPGHTYAFVRFRNVMAACKAKESLHEKLFGNPRVHICFARSKSGSSHSERNSMNAHSSPRGRPYGRQGSSESFHQDRSSGNLPGDPSMRSSPRFHSNSSSGDPDVMSFESFDRKRTLWADGNVPFEQRRLQGHGPELEVHGNMHEHRSPPRDSGSRFQYFSPPPPPQQFPPRQGPLYDDSWDLPEEPLEFHGSKKLKTIPFPSDAELPEYPYSDTEQVKHVLPRVSDLSRRGTRDENFESGHFMYNNQICDPATNSRQPYGEGNDPQNSSYDNFQGGSVSLPPPNPVDWKRSTPEVCQPLVSQMWKWEGTIAKGGTPVCRARCFPVGKVLDMPLPEILDCTARTSLNMLSTHYYQATSAWVVFFVPGSDADMGFYNEFMNYLGEKERAAVVKLDDKNTLFIVPPSDFSEKVLKVSGKLSISGVILRLEPPLPPPPPTGLGPLPPPPVRANTNFTSFHSEAPYPFTPSIHNHGNYRANLSLPPHLPTTDSPVSFVGPSQSNMSTTGFISDGRQAHHLQNFNSGGRIMSGDPMVQSYNPAMPRMVQEPSTSAYTTGIPGPPLARSGGYPHQETTPTMPSSMPMAALQPDQLAQLASTILGQQRQPGGGVSIGENFMQVNGAESSFIQSPNYPPQNIQYPMQQFQQQISNISATPQREGQLCGQGSQLAQGSGGGQQEEGDTDPQKRLQATLQLAAALLQQIQQGKST